MAWGTRFLPLTVVTALVGITVLTSQPGRLQAQEGSASAPTAESVVEQMAQAIQKLKSLQVEGTIKVEEQLSGRRQSVELAFELKLRRPDRLYFKSEQGLAGFLAVWDGTVGWTYARHNDQYQKVEKLSGPRAFIRSALAAADLVGFPLVYARHLLAPDPKVSLREGVARMELTGGGSSGDYVLALHKEEGEIETLTVAKTDFLLRSFSVDLTPRVRKQYESQNRSAPPGLSFVVTVTFTKVKRDEAIDAGVFEFVPPESAELVQRFGPRPLTGKPAPDFTLPGLSGEQVTLSQLRGKVVLLDFWATRSQPCVEAMPHLEELHQEFGDKGLVLLGVTNDDMVTIQTFVKQRRISFTILLDPQGTTGQAYRIAFVPRTLIIDAEGTVAADFMGATSEETLRAKLAELGIK